MAGDSGRADREYMRRALALAERGWGRVRPNPLVGAVVVRGGEAVGEGFHGEYGGPHAEVGALTAAGERARGATLYVTLEPCAHHGKTPPCTDAVQRAGIARVVYAAEDPHPEHGGGAERLRGAGLEVVGGVEREAARAQNAAFFHAVEHGSGFVALKYALSLDARLAAAEGEATRVTGAAADEEVQRLRAGFDAIMVGSRTARTDDPRLTVRGPVTPRVPPVRIVVDTEARLPTESRLARTADEAPVWVLCADDAPAERRRVLEGAGVRFIGAPRAPGGIALGAALERVWDDGVRSVLCEGGGRLGSALLTGQHVRRLYLFYAPRLFGAGGVPAFPSALPPEARDGWRLRAQQCFDGDALLTFDREH